MAHQPVSKCVRAGQDLEARLLGSLDQKLTHLEMGREGSNDESRLSARAASASSTMPASDGFMTFDPSMPSTQSMQQQQQQQGEEEEEGRQAAYERMQVSF